MRKSTFKRSAPKTRVSTQNPVPQTVPQISRPISRIPMTPIQTPIVFPKNLGPQNVAIIGDPNPPRQMANPPKNPFIIKKPVTGKIITETPPMVPRKFNRKNTNMDNTQNDIIIEKIKMNDIHARLRDEKNEESAREIQMEIMRRKIEAQKSFSFEATHTVKPQIVFEPPKSSENLLVSTVIHDIIKSENLQTISNIVEIPKINIHQIDTVKSDLDIDFSAFTVNNSKITLDTPEVTLDTPEVTLDTPEVTLDTPEVTLDTPEVTLDL